MSRSRVRGPATLAALLVGLGTSFCSTTPPEAEAFATPAASPATEAVMRLTSSAFAHESIIPQRFTCDGDDVSPALTWDAVPDGTGSFALIMDDPDAPPGTWVHWVLWNLDGTARDLPEGLVKAESLESGASQGACWGVDSFSRVGYHGPCPPPGNPHRYYFKLYALDTRLELPVKATKSQVEKAMEGHILAEAMLMGTFGR